MQERLELLFETFLKVRTIAKVMREFNDRGLELPRRDRHGDLHWARATTSVVAAILNNPAYAGALVCGRTRLRKPSDGRLPTKVPKPDRAMADYRQGPLSSLYSLAKLQDQGHRQRQPSRIHAQQD